MLDIIKNNPFRILGVFADEKTSQILSNTRKMAAYAKVGRAVEYPTDLNNLLPAISRDSKIIQNAQAEINLPKDKIKYALFWFCNASSLDKVAFDNLAAGNIEKANEIFSKKDTFSSILNRAVLSLIQDNISSASEFYTLLLHNDTFRQNFVVAICGDAFQISENDLAHYLLDELLNSWGGEPKTLINYFSNINDQEYLKSKIVEEYIGIINTEISKAKAASPNSPVDSLKAGQRLMKNTKKTLIQLESLIGTSNLQYQTIADNLAKQILQCGINYYNNSAQDSEEIENSLTLQQYALKISQGQITKDRCRQNVEILLHKKKQSAYARDIAAIVKELQLLQAASPSINRASLFVDDCKPHLNVIKTNLGATNDEYLKISSIVAHNALGMVIEVVNDAQSNISSLYGLSNIATTITQAAYAMDKIGSLHMTYKERVFFNENKKILDSMVSQLRSSTKNSSSRTSKSDSGDTNWGCIIWTVIWIIIIIISIING